MPTLAGFLLFLRNIAGISSSVLPDNSPTIPYAFAYAQNIVSEYLALISGEPYSLYTIATYNLATHVLVSSAQDQQGAVFVGYIAGNNLTVTTLTSGTIVPAQQIVGIGVQPCTLIIGGSSLNWEVNPSQNYGSLATPFNMTTQFTYFSGMREKYQLNSFVAGVVQTSSDESTSTTIKVSENMDRLTFQQLDATKTPWGRQYLNLANEVGSPFGIS